MSIPQQPGNNFGGATEGWGEMGEMAKQYHPMAQMGLQMGNLFVQKRVCRSLCCLRVIHLLLDLKLDLPQVRSDTLRNLCPVLAAAVGVRLL